jgi:hypothetical protein
LGSGGARGIIVCLAVIVPKTSWRYNASITLFPVDEGKGYALPDNFFDIDNGAYRICV